ncbi:MAG: ATP-binding cassette domain-containing protein [Methanomicrobiales archaeon]
MLEISVSRQLRDYELSVNLTVKPGEFLILTGNNGAGKSTILNIVAGFMIPDHGYIRADGKTMFDSANGTTIPPEERQIGYVFQNSAVFPHLTVSENIAYGLRAKGMDKSVRDRKVAGLIERLKLDQLLDYKADKLSGGQMQLVALGRAIAIDPVLLLLDEPYQALDSTVYPIVKDCIQDIVQSLEIPCILVTHQDSDQEPANCRTCRIHEGKIVDPFTFVDKQG